MQILNLTIKRSLCLILGILVIGLSDLSTARAQSLGRKLIKGKPAGGAPPVVLPGFPAFAPAVVAPAPPAAVPTITAFTPASAATGQTVLITGTDFGPTPTVTFNGVSATNIAVDATGTHLTAVVGAGASGNIVVKNAVGPSAPIAGFIYIPPPTISSVTPANFTTGTLVTIVGTNFSAPMNAAVDGIATGPVTYLSPTAATFVVTGPVTAGKISISTSGGQASYPSDEAAQGNTDLTLPDLGRGFTVVPTPTFIYTKVHQSGRAGLTAVVWGNSLGTDSTRQKVGSKLLLPQTSLFGLKLEGACRLTPDDAKFSLLLDGEVNFLVKKVAYDDTAAKTSVSFDPFVIHPRLGLTASIFNGDVYAGFYWHFLCVLTENNSFAQFFNTGIRNVFVYPEFNVGSIFDVSHGGKQSVKIELDMLVNNGDAQNFYPTGNNVIPYLKIGFLTKL